MFHPKRLVFCGGGTRCIAFVEALVELEAVGVLQDVKEYWGTSAGAFVAILMAIGVSPARIKPIVESTDFREFRDMDITNILNIANTWGLDSGRSLIAVISRVIELLTPGSSAYTLKDVPSLHIVVSDVTNRKILVLNSATHPDLNIVQAVRASMGLPLFYCPYKHPESGNLWIDGALRANFAWNLLPTDADRRESLGFCFSKTLPKDPLTNNGLEGPHTFVEYMFSMVHFDEPAKQTIWKRDWPHNILWFPTPPFPAWYMKLVQEDFDLLWASGREVARAWISMKDFVSETVETHPLCAPLKTLTLTHQASPTESSGIPLSCPSQPGKSVVPQSPVLPQGFRRWSL